MTIVLKQKKRFGHVRDFVNKSKSLLFSGLNKNISRIVKAKSQELTIGYIDPQGVRDTSSTASR
jgi:hypothetical protein